MGVIARLDLINAFQDAKLSTNITNELWDKYLGYLNSKGVTVEDLPALVRGIRKYKMLTTKRDLVSFLKVLQDYFSKEEILMYVKLGKMDKELKETIYKKLGGRDHIHFSNIAIDKMYEAIKAYLEQNSQGLEVAITDVMSNLEAWVKIYVALIETLGLNPASDKEYGSIAEQIVRNRFMNLKEIIDDADAKFGEEVSGYVKSLTQAVEVDGQPHTFSEREIAKMLSSAPGNIRSTNADQAEKVRKLMSSYVGSVKKKFELELENGLTDKQYEDRVSNVLNAASKEFYILRAPSILSFADESISSSIDFLMGKSLEETAAYEEDYKIPSSDVKVAIYKNLKLQTNLTAEQHASFLATNTTIYTRLTPVQIAGATYDLQKLLIKAFGIAENPDTIPALVQIEELRKLGFDINTIYTFENLIPILNSGGVTFRSGKYKEEVLKNIQFLTKIVGPQGIHSIVKYNFRILYSDNLKLQAKIAEIIKSAKTRKQAKELFVKFINSEDVEILQNETDKTSKSKPESITTDEEDLKFKFERTSFDVDVSEEFLSEFMLKDAVEEPMDGSVKVSDKTIRRVPKGGLDKTDADEQTPEDPTPSIGNSSEIYSKVVAELEVITAYCSGDCNVDISKDSYGIVTETKSSSIDIKRVIVKKRVAKLLEDVKAISSSENVPASKKQAVMELVKQMNFYTNQLYDTKEKLRELDAETSAFYQTDKRRKGLVRRILSPEAREQSENIVFADEYEEVRELLGEEAVSKLIDQLEREDEIRSYSNKRGLISKKLAKYSETYARAEVLEYLHAKFSEGIKVKVQPQEDQDITARISFLEAEIQRLTQSIEAKEQELVAKFPSEEARQVHSYAKRLVRTIESRKAEMEKYTEELQALIATVNGTSV